MIKKRKTRKEVYFIASRYRNNPINVTFYSKSSGERVPKESVEKVVTSKGVKFFATLWAPMGKKKKFSQIPIDFDYGIGEIIPSTQQAYSQQTDFKEIRVKEKSSLVKFQDSLKEDISSLVQDKKVFPTKQEVFVFIFQYLVGQTDYHHRDIDNMAKTILDTLKGVLYQDDGQVKTLLVGKKIEKRVPQNFAYLAVKILSKDQDIDALKISGVERSVTMFNELKKQGIL